MRQNPAHYKLKYEDANTFTSIEKRLEGKFKLSQLQESKSHIMNFYLK